MAGIQDAIIRKAAIGNYRKNLAGGLGSPQLSPELLKALKIPKGADKSVFERLIGGYDKASKQNAENLQGLGFQRFDGALGSNEAETPQGAILSTLGEGFLNIPSAFAQVYSPVKSLLEAPFIAGKDYLSDKSVKEKGRQSLGQDILRQLSAQDRMQQGQLPRQESSTMGQGSGEYLDTRGQDETGIEAAIGDENTGKYLNQEEMKQKIIENTQLGDMSQEGADMEVITSEMREPVLSAAEILQKKQQELFKGAMKDFNSIYSDDKKPSGSKTIEEYKADFAKATGIDVSGEPDNKLALMSLGLSLMQNKAGKDFNLSNIIGSAGEAGQAAMPLFQKAKDDARAGQVAAGKFALQERKADDITKSAFLKEKRAALNALSKETRTEQSKYIVQAMKDKNDIDVAMINARAKALKDGKLNLKKSISQQVQGLKGVEIQFGFDQDGNEKILNPTSSARGLADGYGNLLQANDSINYLLNVNTEIAQSGSPAAYLLTERAKGLLTTLGVRGEDLFKDQTYEDANGNKIVMKGISQEAGAKAVQDRLLAQFKRFLSQETGNGISNIDFKNLEKQVGRIDLATNPNERIMRLNELKKMFAVPMNRVKSLFDQLNDRRFHTNDDNYTRTQEILLDVLKRSTPKQYQNRITKGKSGGIKIIDISGN